MYSRLTSACEAAKGAASRLASSFSSFGTRCSRSELRPAIASYAVLILSQLCDVYSSLGADEGNVFMRQANSLTFDPVKGLVIKGVWLLVMLTCSWGVFEAFKGWKRPLAMALAACVPMQWAYQTFQVAFTNMLFRMFQ